jgi:hypothetical protein
MCDVNELAGILAQWEDEPDFITQARLRPTAEILDAQDLTMKIHWALRNAYLKGECVPPDLDWREEDDGMPVNLCQAARVVQERHYALNWLVTDRRAKKAGLFGG